MILLITALFLPKKNKNINYFDNILKLEKKTSITVLNNIINFFPEISFAKKYSRNLLKAFLMDAKGKNIKLGMTWSFIVNTLPIQLEDL